MMIGVALAQKWLRRTTDGSLKREFPLGGYSWLCYLMGPNCRSFCTMSTG